MRKAWDGRFKGETEGLVEEFTQSIGFDHRLYREDIQGSIAHCEMLVKQEILSADEGEKIIFALKEILKEIEEGRFVFSSKGEDIHMHVERRLIEKIGGLGGKLHTGRSRNDQVVLDERLHMKGIVSEILIAIQELQRVLVRRAREHIDTVMPGYTHLQHAQPVRLAFHLLAYVEMLERDRGRFADCLKRLDVCPLGAGALAGTSFPIDREFVAERLGFSRVSLNAMDAVGDRDFLVEFLSDAAVCMVHLSRMAEELVLWSTQEFSFVELPDAYCTGSSIMPQKKNPDVAELIRGKMGRTLGNLVALFTVLKALPMAYNRDLQEDKEPYFDTVDALASSLKLMAGMMERARFNVNEMRRRVQEGFTTATDLADYLVKKGLPFREAHRVVGKMVAFCIDKGMELEALTLVEMRRFTPLVDEGVYKALDVESSVDSKNSLGGTSKHQVEERLSEWESKLFS